MTEEKDLNPVSVALEVVPVPTAPIERAGRDNFFHQPISASLNLTMEVLSAGDDINEIGERKQLYSKGTNVLVQQDGPARRVSMKSNKSEVYIEVDDIALLSGSNKPAKKILTLTLININDQALSGNQLTRDYVTFPLKDLVDYGMYKTLPSARAGFKTAAKALTSMKFGGEDLGTSAYALEVLFPGARIQKGMCIVRINNALDWGNIARFFTILPKYYFRLSNRASDLLWYIFYVARQRTKEIREHGYFTISFRAIHHRLQLPPEEGNSFPGRTIKEPIEDAIVEIEDAHHQMYGTDDFSLEPIYDDNAPIRKFLDQGYLKVSLTGNFSEVFLEIAESKRKKLETAAKRKARIEEKAKVAVLTEKLKKDDESPP